MQEGGHHGRGRRIDGRQIGAFETVTVSTPPLADRRRPQLRAWVSHRSTSWGDMTPGPGRPALMAGRLVHQDATRWSSTVRALAWRTVRKSIAIR